MVRQQANEIKQQEKVKTTGSQDGFAKKSSAFAAWRLGVKRVFILWIDCNYIVT